jgi:pimeloyl-ACP methyl ester carboxylesterase
METQYLVRSEGKLAFTDFGGEGPLVLMLPGMGALRSEYRFLAPDLQQAGYHPVAADLRGQGDSSVPWSVYDVPSVGGDILALIDHLGGGGAHLIGTSFSAAPVVWAAVERPDCVSSLVLIGPFVRSAKMNPVMQALFWLMLNNPWRAKTWVTYYRRLYPTRKPADFEDYLARLRANMEERGRFDAAVALGNSSRQPSVERLPKVKTPALVIMGSKDPDFPDPAAEGKWVAEEVHGTLALIDGAGHYPQTEMPDKTTPVILDFLNSTN